MPASGAHGFGRRPATARGNGARLTDQDRSAAAAGTESLERHRDGQGTGPSPTTANPGGQPGSGGAERRTHLAGNPSSRRSRGPLYAALDLGTNNCRLLIARPHENSFRVLDGFTRIVRLGEGLSTTGRLSDAAMERTMEALRLCRNKLREPEPARMRLIATEACRAPPPTAPRFMARVDPRNRASVLEIVRPRDGGVALR
jgi:exopolyphosphatase/guanosine-5'-triphosphate,3'-diphosphate pyrophosphatase